MILLVLLLGGGLGWVVNRARVQRHKQPRPLVPRSLWDIRTRTLFVK
jgi:hypothetical protein